MKIGTYRGLDLNLSFDTLHKTFHATLKGSMSYGTDLGTDVHGNIIRLNNAVAELPQRLTSVQNQLENLHQQVKNAEMEKQKPFPYEKELTDKAALLALLDAELNMDASHEQRGPEQMELDGFAAKDRAASAKAKPSILESLKAAAPSARPAPDNAPDKNKKTEISI